MNREFDVMEICGSTTRAKRDVACWTQSVFNASSFLSRSSHRTGDSSRCVFVVHQDADDRDPSALTLTQALDHVRCYRSMVGALGASFPTRDL